MDPEHSDFIKPSVESVLKKEGKPLGLGDAIASVATPIARILKLPCIDPATNELRPDSPCAKKKAILNKAIPKINPLV